MDKFMEELKKTKSSVNVSLLSDETSPCVVAEWMSTGCLALDAIMGGGLPIGRITEIYGGSSSGKSLIAAQVAAQAQSVEDRVVYVDTETAVSIEIMKMVGVDVDSLVYANPDTIEDVFTIYEEAIKAHKKINDGKKLLLIWDSIAATSNQAEMDNPYGKATMGKHAQLMSQGLRKLTRYVANEHVCCLFLNQIRKKIGVMFGDDTATFGGLALEFHTSVRVVLRSSKKIKDGKRTIGINSIATVSKNKVAVPFKSCILPIYFGHGVKDEEAAFEYLNSAGLLNRSGSYYTINTIEEAGKFIKADFNKFYDTNYDAISDLVMNTGIYAEDDDEDTIE